MPEPLAHGSGPYSHSGSRHSLFHAVLRQSATHTSSHEPAEIECKSNDPDKKRAIQVHPSWLVNEVVLYVFEM